jgi:hypothetical protein
MAVRNSKVRGATQAACLSRSRGAKTGRPAEIAARHRIAPFRQGDLDCLCAIYAAINAARLARAAHGVPLSIVDSTRLYVEATARLARRHGLHEALTWGVETRRWLAITRHVAALVSSASLTVIVERPVVQKRSVDQLLCWIEQSVTDGKPVLIRLIGAAELDHFTVVAGCSATSLLLFDSGLRRYVRKDSIALRTGTNVIPAASILRLALEPLG